MRKILTILLTILLVNISYSQDTNTIKTIDLVGFDVSGIRSDNKTPISQKTISKEDIDKSYHSQEVPILLNTSPNITSSSDGGHNLGYTYFRLRGIDQTRINMTLDGVPLNEPEDQGVYFSNYPDFINSIKSLQIQRGVGTSTNGVSSYAGSINFESEDGLNKGTEAQIGYGEFKTYRVSIENKTGLLENKTAFYTRFSSFGTNGYKYNSGSDGYSFFMSGGWYGKKDIVKVTAFSGRSFNKMSWFAVSENDISFDPRTNYNTTRENDDFMQSMAILKYSHIINDNSSISTSVFYNRLDGNWTLDLLPLGGGDMVLNYQLFSNFYGIVSNYNLSSEKIRLNFGISSNIYERTHSMAISPDSDKLYTNIGNKSELGSYIKLGYDIKKLTLFADAQVRYVDFKYSGPNLNMDNIQWSFFNPKGGIMYTKSKNINFYTSVGKSYREPTRTDMFAGEDDPTEYYDIKEESVIDYELGSNLNFNIFKLQTNIYYMDFKNEITLLGALGSNGLPLMTNVDKSFRSGIEFDMSLKLFNKQNYNVEITNSSSYSYNRIDDNGKEFQPLYTPELVSNSGFWIMDENNKVKFGFDVKYHSESFIDWENTLVTPAFTIFGTQLSIKFYKENSISFRVNNLTNEEYYTNGYGVGNERHFFVNSPTDYFITLKLKF